MRDITVLCDMRLCNWPIVLCNCEIVYYRTHSQLIPEISSVWDPVAGESNVASGGGVQ